MNQDSAIYTFGDTALRPTLGGRLDKLCMELKDEFPKLTMHRKVDRWYWRWIAVFLKVITFGKQKTFNSNFTTTIGMVIGWGENKWEQITKQTPGWEDSVWSCLMHERKHLRRFKQYGVLLCALLYLLVFFPVGLAWGRAWFEREGYIETLRCWYVLDPTWAASTEARAWWVSQFVGANYGWMWPFRQQVQRWFDTELARLQGATTSTG